jgi:SAM-dependent methyltransferase
MANIIVLERARLTRPLRLLDIACGQGRLRPYCAGMPDIHFTGLDISDSSLQFARERGYTDVVIANLRHGLPLANDAFEVVVCSYILEQLQSPDMLVDEVERVLVPGGLFLVGAPIRTWWNRLLRIYVVPLLNRKKRDVLAAGMGPVQFFTLESLKILLYHFRIENLRGYRFFSAGRWLALENRYWFYRINAAWGKRFPHWSSEIIAVARKRSRTMPVETASGGSGGTPQC